MSTFKRLAFALVFCVPMVGIAQNANHPCAALHTLCQQNGYMPNQWKQGTGLWKDCMCPATGSAAAPANAKAFPAGAQSQMQSLGQACKAKRPNICTKH